MATRSMPFWPRPATTSGSSWPGSGLCAPFSGRLSWSGITRAAPPPHPPERPNSLFHRRLASLAAPDPSEPDSGTRLPPWVSDGETFTRPGVKEVRSGEPGVGQLRHPRPCEPVFLAGPPQRAPPQVGHMVAEGHEGTAVRWHRMISKVAADHLPQPAPLDGDRLMHAPPQRVLDPPQGRPHAVGATLPLELEGAPAGPPADVGEPQEAERLRFAEPALGAPVRREAAKRVVAGLVPLQRQRKRLQARAHRVPEAPGIGLVLETDHDVE